MMEGGPEHPPNPRCLGVIEDERGLLWSFCLKPAANWKKAYERLKTRIPQRGIAELPGDLIDRQFLYVTHVEVIDPVAKQVVAVGSLNREVISLLADRRVAVLTESEDGVPVLRILRTNLTGYRR
jgi:hypothetical protein